MTTKRSGFTSGEKLAFAPFPHRRQWNYSHGRVWGGVGVVVVILVNQFSDDKDVSVFTLNNETTTQITDPSVR